VKGIVWVGVGVAKAKTFWEVGDLGVYSALVGLLFPGVYARFAFAKELRESFFLLRCIICCGILYIFST
jgi:hypothetical protein